MSMDNGFNLRAGRAEFSFSTGSIKLYGYERRDRKKYVAKKLEMEEVNTPPMTPIEPFAVIDDIEAQRLMDDLWDCGLRPSEGTGSAGAMAAVQNHLQDMETIAFHVLKIPKKEK